MTTSTPPAVPEAVLAPALDRLVAALGTDAVLTDEEQLKEFRDPFTFAEWADHRGAAVVMPETVEQVQEVVRIANEFGVPLWTSSQGRNNAYGGAAPRLSGSIQVSLRRMNRILEVDEELGYAVVEPGVSFFELYEHFRANGHRLWPQLPDLSWGSVVGNTLDHGVGTGRPGQHPDRACGMEVVLGNGEVLRTGMGALPGAETWHTYQRGFGPALDPLFMQSNFGIVTKMGVWCMPEPEVYQLCLVTTERQDAVPELVDTIRPFVLDGTIPSGLAITRATDSSKLVELRDAVFSGQGPSREQVAESLKTRSRSAPWMLRFPLYGSADVVAAQWAQIQQAFAGVEAAVCTARTFAGDRVHEETRNHAEMCAAGVPNNHLWALVELWEGVGGHIDFSPVLPLKGADAARVMSILRPVIEDAGLVYSPTFSIIGRTMFHVVPTFFDTSNEAQTRAAFEQMYPQAIAACAEAGYGLYRTHVHFMDEVMDTYSFNDHVLRRFLETIKDGVDPNGVLSPGKSGIWPRSLRPDRRPGAHA
ncbi:FAD-binding oxidoreductase [Geodermatophilus sp. URMC 62]|uniref:FAD-binding oxidoreductase n=1 Tax=Geodermatophilus sp. URMC 62 TaxID=3423414 RepID=UPI00406BFEBE